MVLLLRVKFMFFFFAFTQMNWEKLIKMVGSVRTRGKGTVRVYIYTLNLGFQWKVSIANIRFNLRCFGKSCFIGCIILSLILFSIFFLLLSKQFWLLKLWYLFIWKLGSRSEANEIAENTGFYIDRKLTDVGYAYSKSLLTTTTT